MDGNILWNDICDKVQHRVIQVTPLDIKSAKELRGQIFKCLNTAHNDRILKTKHENIHQLLKMTRIEKGKIAIVGGERNFRRDKNIPNFECTDGCWFDFSILVDEALKPAEVIGFDFEIRFPESGGVSFLRFDLNIPDHENEERGMRFHIHPGSDDFMVHSPPMSPLEILHLFLYGLPIAVKPRSS